MMSRRARAGKDCCVFHSRVITLRRVMEMVRAGVWEAWRGENGMVFELEIVMSRKESGNGWGKVGGSGSVCTREEGEMRDGWAR